MRYLKMFISAILAGVCIGLGGMAFLCCDSKVVGAFLFCLGLCTICTFGLYLYTGKIGYLFHVKQYADLPIGWIGNLLGAAASGKLFLIARPDLAEKCQSVCANKLAETMPQALVLSTLCGVLVYIAVELYKRLKDRDFIRYTGILLCIPAFILCGFEHSIADMFYLTCGGSLLTGLGFLLVVTIGNSLGALAFDSLLTVMSHD